VVPVVARLPKARMPPTTSLKATLSRELDRLLNARYPKTICPSEVARKVDAATLQASGLSDWRELMPAIRDLLWEMRDNGEVQILQRGDVISDDVAVEDVRGPIRARKSSD